MTDPLQDLLQSAAAELEGALSVPSDLGQSVRALDADRRRRSRRLAIAMPAAALGIGFAVYGLSGLDHSMRGPLVAKTNHTVAASESLPEAAESDPIRLAALADVHYKLAMRLVASRSREKAEEQIRAASDGVEPQESAREQLEIVAYRMIIRADSLRAAMRPAAEVSVIYHNVVHLFPNTQSADLARQRLTELGISHGDI